MQDFTCGRDASAYSAPDLDLAAEPSGAAFEHFLDFKGAVINQHSCTEHVQRGQNSKTRLEAELLAMAHPNASHLPYLDLRVGADGGRFLTTLVYKNGPLACKLMSPNVGVVSSATA